MLKKLKLLVYAFMATVALAACSGDDGDPGPQGEPGEKGDPGAQGNSEIVKIGAFEGTVSGHRQDGTAFSESFKFEYTYDSIQTFSPEADGSKFIYLERNLYPTGDAYMNMALSSPTEGQLVPEESSYSIHFRFFKELSNNELFVVDARPYFGTSEGYVMELSLDQNRTYRFESDEDGTINYYNGGWYNDVYVNTLFVYTPTSYYHVMYEYETGELYMIVQETMDGSSEITSGPVFDKYNQLEFVYDETHGMHLFFNASNGAGVYEVVPDLGPDQFIITNYNHNASTGVLSFNFEITVSKYLSNGYRQNSTGHDLTIKGTFNSGQKVYKNVVGRTKS